MEYSPGLQEAALDIIVGWLGFGEPGRSAEPGAPPARDLGRRPLPRGGRAAIAAVHSEAETADVADWPQILQLYEALCRLAPTPVVRLNRAVAVAMAVGIPEGLAEVEQLSAEFGRYHLYHSAHADLLRRLGRLEEARTAYQSALELCQNDAERRFLRKRLRS